jgi:hypothetical protein
MFKINLDGHIHYCLRNALVHHVDDTEMGFRLTRNDDSLTRSISGKIGKISGNRGLF